MRKSELIKRLLKDAKACIRTRGIRHSLSENDNAPPEYFISDGGWLLCFFNNVFRDGRTVLNDVIFFTEHADEWAEYKGRFYIGTNGWLYAFERFSVSRKKDGIKLITSLLEATLQALEPYFPKSTEETYLPKES